MDTKQSTVYLTLTNVPPEEWSYRVRRGVWIIGRSRNAHIRLPSRFLTVSRRHAELSANAGSLMIRDMESSGGTRVNGVWIDNRRKVGITLGDRLSLGGVEIKLLAELSQIAQVMAEIDGFDDEPETFIESANSRSRMRHLLERLSPAELNVMLWMCRGRTDDDDLAGLLDRSPHTVRTQIGNILQKLELHSRAEIISWLHRSAAGRPGEERETALIEPHGTRQHFVHRS